MRVFVIDDEPDVRDFLVELLSHDGYAVHPYASAREFLAELDQDGPACVLTDLRMPGLSGRDLVRTISQRRLPLATVVLTAFADVPTAVSLMQEGAHELLEKSRDPEAIRTTVRRACQRARTLWQHSQTHRGVQSRLDTLSARERQVLELVVAGKPSKVIADELSISVNTVEVHRARIMQKMAAGCVADLVRIVVSAQHQFSA